MNRTVIVHQFDAHAWNEVWLEGRGWVRVDPTAAVAPERILYGLEQALASEGSFLAQSPLSPLRYRNIDWVNALRLRYDALTYRWQSWVTGFNGDTQFDLLRRYLGEISVTRSLSLLLGCAVLTLAVVSLLLWRRSGRAPRPLFETELWRYTRALQRRGLAAIPGETPAQLTERAARRWPRHAEQIRALYRALARLVYAPRGDATQTGRRRRQLRRRLRRLQFMR